MQGAESDFILLQVVSKYSILLKIKQDSIEPLRQNKGVDTYETRRSISHCRTGPWYCGNGSFRYSDRVQRGRHAAGQEKGQAQHPLM